MRMNRKKLASTQASTVKSLHWLPRAVEISLTGNFEVDPKDREQLVNALQWSGASQLVLQCATAMVNLLQFASDKGPLLENTAESVQRE
jgi:hypothetical protein